jgi:hypothetical protein
MTPSPTPSTQPEAIAREQRAKALAEKLGWDLSPANSPEEALGIDLVIRSMLAFADEEATRTPSPTADVQGLIEAALKQLDGLRGAFTLLGRLDMSSAISRDISSNLNEALAALRQSTPQGVDERPDGVVERARIVEWLKEPSRLSVPTMDKTWSAAWNACLSYVADHIERGDHLTALPASKEEAGI